MDDQRKGRMFDLLVNIGFKEIEVGYPAASESDFSFIRNLVREGMIPNDVTISVFTPARPDLIDRTFESLEGVDRAVVHLCLATACLWRDVVFRLSADELLTLTCEAARHVTRCAEKMPKSTFRFEYSPETFNMTEPEFALTACNNVAKIWDACPQRPVTLNLPSTVETDSPNVYADQIEWMHRNLENRDSIILSVHPHNDRGTAVASAELALMAGAERVEGTLFGNGERTGNVCLATLGLNLFSRGFDPKLNFSDIDGIRSVVEECNQMPVHARHPYVGDLVYTAFSGTHQDAVAKGLAALEAKAEDKGKTVRELPWEVPYLPIDPKDVGRSYESVVRLSSQSGKGGIAHILRTRYGLDLPRELRVHFASRVQELADRSGTELDSRQVWDLFRKEYVLLGERWHIQDLREEYTPGAIDFEAHLILEGDHEIFLRGRGQTREDAISSGFNHSGYPLSLKSTLNHEVTDYADTTFASYAQVLIDGTAHWGVGLDAADAKAVLKAALSALGHQR